MLQQLPQRPHDAQSIDSAGTRRSRPFLCAAWQHLLILNYEIEPAVLAPYVPPGTELDDFEGRTLISVIGFRFKHARFHGMPVPFHQEFPEVNLRIYVRRYVSNEIRRGVVFVKEIVPRRLVAWTACGIFKENFVRLPMQLSTRVTPPTTASTNSPFRYIEFSWTHAGQICRLAADLETNSNGSKRQELSYAVDRWWAYSRKSQNKTIEYFVDHAQWQIWPVRSAMLDCNVATLYGPQFENALGQPPSSAGFADGSAVAVYPGYVVS